MGCGSVLVWMHEDENEPAALLSEVGLLNHLSAIDLGRLAQIASLKWYDKGDLLFEEGGEPGCLFVLLDGLVELFATRRKREAAVLIMWPPAIILPAAALSSERYLLAGRALTKVKAIALDAQEVRKEVERSAALARLFTSLLAAQFRLLVRQVKDQKLRGGPQRLCAFLSRVLRETGKDGFADLPIAKATLASRLGMTPESLSRALHVVEENGIAMRGSRIILLDPDRVSRFCDPDPLFDGPDRRFNLNHF